jgi:hypothetical protein
LLAAATFLPVHSTTNGTELGAEERITSAWIVVATVITYRTTFCVTLFVDEAVR